MKQLILTILTVLSLSFMVSCEKEPITPEMIEYQFVASVEYSDTTLPFIAKFMAYNDTIISGEFPMGKDFKLAAIYTIDSTITPQTTFLVTGDSTATYNETKTNENNIGHINLQYNTYNDLDGGWINIQQFHQSTYVHNHFSIVIFKNGQSIAYYDGTDSSFQIEF